MASDVVVPEVGELGMEVVFVRWLKRDGESVAVGDELFEVDTEKSVMVVEAYAAGTLVDLRAAEGDVVAPRAVIGRILAPGEDPGETAATAPSTNIPTIDIPLPSSSPGPAGSSPAAPAAGSAASGSGAHGGVSPRGRRVAAELGVNVEAVTGTGPDGLVTEADVRAAASGEPASAMAAAARPVDTVSRAPSADLSERARRAVAELTTSAWQTIPHFYLQLEADVDRALGLARPTPLLCAAVARALARHPECNLAWSGNQPVRRASVDLGLLVDTPTGLLITVVSGADALDLAGMAEAVAAAADRARRASLAAADLGARSLTISNLGMYAVDRFSAVIPKPDILALAVGRVRTVARAEEGTLVPRRVVDLTLSADHRALDGATAARFMTTLEAILADPAAEGLA